MSLFMKPKVTNPIQSIPRSKDTSCRVKIKKSPNGSEEIIFSGECSKSQLEIAKSRMSDDDTDSEG